MSVTDGGPMGGSGNPWSWSGLFSKPKQDVKPQDNVSDDNDGVSKDNKRNNIDPNINLIQDTWKDHVDPNKKVDDVAEKPAIQPGSPPDPKAELKKHLDDVGLGDLTLTDAEIEAFKSGENVADILGKINQRIQTSYLKSMSNFSTVMEKKIEAAVEKAVQQSASMFEGERLRDILYEELPFTRDTAIAPIAETVLRQYLSKNMSKKDAIEATKKYFKHMQKSMDPDYVEPNPNTRTNFRGNPPPGDAKGLPAGDNQSWLAVLKGERDSKAG